LVKIKLNKADP